MNEDITLLLLLEARDLATGVIGRVRASLHSLSGPQKVLAAGLAATAVGGIAAAYEIAKFADHSTKAAAVFQQNSVLLSTQAGVAKSRIAALGDSFLTLAPKVGQTATDLNKAFFYIAAASIPVKQQFDALKYAAEGAAVGNANLKDTTNAMVGIMRSGVPGIHGARDAVATMLAIVGTGKMRLNDFNSAMGTGIAGAASAYKVSLQSVGAALAYLTDTGMPAQMAATRLTMALTLMAAPSQHAAKILGAIGMTNKEIAVRQDSVRIALEKAGISYSKMAGDLKRPDGLVVALRDLKTHMTAAGVSSEVQSAIIGRAFGGGHMGKAVMQMWTELDRVQQKFGIINQAIGLFGDRWKQTTETAVFQAKSIHAGMNTIGVAIGEALLPAVQKLLGWLVPIIAKVGEWTTKHKTLAAVILASTFVFSILIAGIAALGLAMLAFEAVSAPVIGIVLGIMAAIALLAYAAYEIHKHWAAIKEFFVQLWADIKKVFFEGIAYVKQHWQALLVDLVMVMLGPMTLIALLFEKNWKAIVKIARVIFDDLSGYLATQWNRITAYAVDVWTRFKGFLGTVWGDILNEAVSAWNNFTSFLGSIWMDVQNGAETALLNLVTSFFGLPGRILATLTNAGSWLVGVGRDIIDGLWSGIQAAWIAVAGFFSVIGLTIKNWFVSAATWLWNEGSSVISGLWSGIQAAWANPVGFFSAIGTTIKNWFVGAVSWLYNEGSAVITGLWNGNAAVWATVNGWFLAMGSRIAGYFVGAVGWLLAEGRDVISGLWNGIAAVWATVHAWFNGMNARVSGYFVGALGWLNAEGHTVISGLWNGIADRWGDVHAWFNGMNGRVSGYFAGAVNWLNAEGHSIISGLWNGIADRWGDVHTWFNGMNARVSGYLAGAVNFLSNEGSSIIQGLWNGMKSKWHDVEGWLSGLPGWIKNLKGPLDKDLVLLQPEGAAIITGLTTGMKSQFGALAGTLAQATAGIVSSATAGVNSSSGRGLALTGSGTGGGGPVTIVFDMRGSQYIDDASIQRLTDKIGGALATKGLPMAGIQLRRS